MVGKELLPVKDLDTMAMDTALEMGMDMQGLEKLIDEKE